MELQTLTLSQDTAFISFPNMDREGLESLKTLLHDVLGLTDVVICNFDMRDVDALTHEEAYKLYLLLRDRYEDERVDDETEDSGR